METKPIYFKSLNGVRAIASVIVVIWHSDQFLYQFNHSSFGFHKNSMAEYAVDMFFVLSGFLITYLLLIEKEQTSTIDLKKFYLRRVYRIWPLYYSLIIISFILVYFGIIPSNKNITSSAFFYLFLMANFAFLLNLSLITIKQLWSVGVEEQFYLFWPHIIKRTSKYLNVFVFCFFIFFMLKILITITLPHESVFHSFIGITRIRIMCLGAIGAYLVYSNHKILKVIYRKEIQIISWAILLVSLYKPLHIHSFIDHEINSIIYFIIILNISSNNKNLISLENSIMNFLGKISYGIYSFHMLVIIVLSKILLAFNLQLSRIPLFILILLITIGVSTLSYYFFEKPFLKIKNRYSVVKSTNNNQN